MEGGRVEIPEGWERWDVEPIRPGRRLTAAERIVASPRFVSEIVASRVMEQPPGSLGRTRLLTLAVRGGFALLSRDDYDRVMNVYREDCEFHFAGLAGVGLPAKATGHEEIEGFFRQFDDVFGTRLNLPREIIDPGGAKVGCYCETVATGHGSGIEITEAYWYAYTLDRGRVCRQVTSSDWEVVLEELRS